MARWSVTTDANGAPNRFWVWDGSTDKFSHTDLQNNWDTLDSVIGGPSTWPTARGPSAGVFGEIASVSSDLCPLGSVIAWWRPSSAVSLPSGWAPCDGRTIAPGGHSYGSGSLTVPDLRNAFVLGSLSPDAVGYPGDGTTGAATNNATDAPSINGRAGSNAPNNHTHTIPHHYHIHAHWHEFNGSTGDGSGNPAVPIGSGSNSASQRTHTHTIDGMTSSARPPGSSTGQTTLQEHTSLPVVNTGGTMNVSNRDNPQSGDNVNSADASNLSSTVLMTTNGASYDPRPRYVGLLYIVKVKRNATT